MINDIYYIQDSHIKPHQIPLKLTTEEAEKVDIILGYIYIRKKNEIYLFAKTKLNRIFKKSSYPNDEKPETFVAAL